ncbi:MAG: succinylglutamate desuccinylase/aspartoacylase family protein, partial [Rhodospirillaceae bacterium]|nr:succinylglutamate desuccinylase/aspartoacylase family protein [Rhodospirillaceae bacterium]
MAKTVERIPLLPSSPGVQRHVHCHRYGAPGARPKAYLQASLHADEIPAMLVQHHLIRLLDEADREGRIRGEILVVPVANPMGAGQVLNHTLLGRYELGGGGNFNRNWPDLSAGLAEAVAGRLGPDATANVAAVRAAMKAALDAMTPTNEMTSLRLALARLACDADIVLDLHCDNEALVHLYLIPALWPDAADLAAETGARAVLLAEDSGGRSFDETMSTPWTRLAAAFPDRPIPPACLSGTVEYRGQADVSDELAEPDAAALFRFLMRRGLVEGDPGPLPPLQCAATDFAACDVVRAPAAGVLAYKQPLGASVAAGTPIAELVDPMAEDPRRARTPVRSGT